MGKYPHMSNAYENGFNYEKWRDNVTYIDLLNVNWDVDYANVPGFESDSERDAWFDGRRSKTLELQTNVREWQTSLKIPLPLDEAQGFNYARVRFSAAPVEGFGTEKRSELFFFIENIAATPAPSTTELSIALDTWTTYIDQVEINCMMLERGHYGMAQTTAAKFLENPLENSDWLLAADVQGGNAIKTAHNSEVLFNGENVKLVIATTRNPFGDSGSSKAGTWAIPTGNPTTQGAPSVYYIATAGASTEALLNALDSNDPAFKQTVIGTFYVSADLLVLMDYVELCGVPCNLVSAAQTELHVLRLDKSMFGYPADYADLAKLYTGAYARIVLSDGQGGNLEIMPEETTGEIDLYASLNLAAPTLSIAGVLTGIGGGKKALQFANVSAQSFSFGGRWYEKLMSWNVPTYAITQSAYTTEDATGFYSRDQALRAAQTAYDNAEASASAGKANVNDSNAASVANNATQVAANVANVQRAISAANEDYGAQNSLNTATQAWNAGYSRDMTAIEIEGQQQAAGVSIGGTVASSIMGAITGAATGGAAGTLAGGIGALPGAIAGGIIGATTPIVNGAISGCTTGLNTAVSVNMSESKTQTSIANTEELMKATNQNNADRTDVSNRAQTDLTAIANDAATAITANSAATSNGNAARTYNTTVANAARSKAITERGVQAGWNAAKLKAPNRFGADAQGLGKVRPLGLFANIVTMSDSDIARVGDQMLRYGYALSRNVRVSSLNVMPKFSYWQASDLWLVSRAGVSEAQQEILKSILKQGVTVWRNPDDIGKVSIYDNR